VKIYNSCLCGFGKAACYGGEEYVSKKIAEVDKTY